MCKALNEVQVLKLKQLILYGINWEIWKLGNIAHFAITGIYMSLCSNHVTWMSDLVNKKFTMKFVKCMLRNFGLMDSWLEEEKICTHIGACPVIWPKLLKFEDFNWAFYLVKIDIESLGMGSVMQM